MDHSRFGLSKSGRLVGIRIHDRYNDYAFIPNLLPGSWTPSEKLWPLIADAREMVGQLNGTGRVLPNPALLLRPLQRREAIKSNTIEGTYVTPQELLLFEASKEHDALAPRAKQSDWLEVIYYDRVLTEGCRRIAEGAAINRELMRALHADLLLGERGKDESPGEFRDTQVYVEAGGRYIPPPPDELEPLLVNLEEYLANPGQIDPLVHAYIAHYQFEAIHPFKDGNGRIGRVLLSLTIYKWLKHANAWLYMSEFFERHRKEYISHLFSVSANGEWEEWIRFCLIGTIETAAASLVRCRALDELKKEYEDRVGHASSRMHWILNRLFSNPMLSITDLAKELDVTYRTARKDIDKLISAGIVQEISSTRPRNFSAGRIFEIAYGE